ncbi:MAG: chromosome segregation protein SMC [Gammaproteobacteria bacterium RIFCSPLOWO2_02_FULL_56_15]|nr:MAG: chromosome segregation protein SMC [Gammaproteobacteria bacterium RIFCSPLOWO2_02_FULL_56_15]
MRLIKIKLAGFKSFVDPITFIIPGNLVGIVGPNGCGKSNIIDAVTWVMGESSAKHLRGDALTDVIFNGSRERQPVGLATVELIFDNTEGKLGGQYASYSEISIKRQINREGISIYTLNGSRCRRRDIQSIFLGTGLGPRSYSIIEQGVVSRLVEAKPDELRSFIEEAAGISKYRERRRETENRMRHTRENLDRLNDLREELSKQLGHLKRQANAAERYKLLKQQERQLSAELLALDWQELQHTYSKRGEKVEAEATRVEQVLAGLRQVESSLETQRQEQTSAHEHLNEAQSGYYRIGSEISQLEQKIHHAGERLRSLESDLAGTGNSLSEIRNQQENDNRRLRGLAEKSERLEPQLKGFRNESNQAYESLNQAEEAMQGWQIEWDSCNTAMSGFARQIEVDGNRVEYLEGELDESRHRREAISREYEEIDTGEIRRDLNSRSGQLEEVLVSIQKIRMELERIQQDLPQSRNLIHGLQLKLTESRALLHKLEGKRASLEALQQHDAGTDQDSYAGWLNRAGLAHLPRLVQQITVHQEWMLALETVLGERLQDICVSSGITGFLGSMAGLAKGSVGIVDIEQKSQIHEGASRVSRLSEKVESPGCLDQFLQQVYTAVDLNEALRICENLQGHESVVTQDGIWLGRNWARIKRQDEQHAGVLLREQQLRQIDRDGLQMETGISVLEQNLAEANGKMSDAEVALQSFQADLNRGQEEYAALNSFVVELKTQLHQTEKRHLQLDEEQAQLDLQEAEDRQELDSLQQRLNRTVADCSKLEGQKASLGEMRECHRTALDQARKRWQATHEQSHEIALQMESITSQRASVEQAIQRTNLQIANLVSRTDNITREMDTIKAPLAEQEKLLTTRLNEKIMAEKTLSEARNRVQMIEMNLRRLEQERSTVEQQLQECRSQLEDARINAQESRIRLQTIEEQLQTQGFIATDLLQQIGTEASQLNWRERLDDVERKIQRLGPINLAAIDEYGQLAERKEYMDRQNQDLSEALKTLENAIHKIDRETRTRFRETFDELNRNLKEMFPVLFGGGHAYLTLTGEDILDTGVTIMAQPPGKRNSTIHLLSGGEKALTAVALVFAIFKLNPAPFCILDEVDAPLDDTNVVRFCELVKQMSVDIQFIFITHNKISMEMAQQLLGVTMHEAGVSRLVSVDMDEAVKIAATA